MHNNGSGSIIIINFGPEAQAGRRGGADVVEDRKCANSKLIRVACNYQDTAQESQFIGDVMHVCGVSDDLCVGWQECIGFTIST